MRFRINKPCPLEDLGIPVPHEGIYTLLMHKQSHTLYGITYPGAKLFKFDIRKRETTIVTILNTIIPTGEKEISSFINVKFYKLGACMKTDFGMLSAVHVRIPKVNTSVWMRYGESFIKATCNGTDYSPYFLHGTADGRSAGAGNVAGYHRTFVKCGRLQGILHLSECTDLKFQINDSIFGEAYSGPGNCSTDADCGEEDVKVPASCLDMGTHIEVSRISRVKRCIKGRCNNLRYEKEVLDECTPFTESCIEGETECVPIGSEPKFLVSASYGDENEQIKATTEYKAFGDEDRYYIRYNPTKQSILVYDSWDCAYIISKDDILSDRHLLYPNGETVRVETMGLWANHIGDEVLINGKRLIRVGTGEKGPLVCPGLVFSDLAFAEKDFEIQDYRFRLLKWTNKTTDIGCNDDTECHEEEFKTYCIGADIFRHINKSTCENPGRPGARCIYQSTVETDTGGCSDGVCINRTCYLKECTNICGGDCPPCEQEKKKCITDYECGRDRFIGETYCMGGNVTKDKVIFRCHDDDMTCLNITETRIVDECRGDEFCMPKRDRCVSDDYCEDSGTYSKSYNCWIALAKKYKDPDYCNKITRNDKRQNCLNAI